MSYGNRNDSWERASEREMLEWHRGQEEQYQRESKERQKRNEIERAWDLRERAKQKEECRREFEDMGRGDEFEEWWNPPVEPLTLRDFIQFGKNTFYFCLYLLVVLVVAGALVGPVLYLYLACCDIFENIR